MPRITTNAPGAAAAGPYSHAAEHAGLVFLSGQTPLDPGTGALLEGEIEAQTRQGFTPLPDAGGHRERPAGTPRSRSHIVGAPVV